MRLEILCSLLPLVLACSSAQITANPVRDDDDVQCPPIIPRKRWGGRPAKTITYQPFPVKYVIVQHTVSSTCSTRLECSRTLNSIQSYHMNQLHHNDIPYNFLISDADIYDGTGWHVRGEHTRGYNTNATGIAFIGNFSANLPTPQALALAKQLLACGKSIGELDEDYILLGARQIISTESPGLELYGEIQEWDHWKSRP